MYLVQISPIRTFEIGGLVNDILILILYQFPRFLDP